MTSNLPPGVTGAEPHLAGPPYDCVYCGLPVEDGTDEHAACVAASLEAMTTTDALALIAAGRSVEVAPGTRALIRRRGWGWYDPRPPRMVLTPRGKAVLEARRQG